MRIQIQGHQHRSGSPHQECQVWFLGDLIAHHLLHLLHHLLQIQTHLQIQPHLQILHSALRDHHFHMIEGHQQNIQSEIGALKEQ